MELYNKKALYGIVIDSSKNEANGRYHSLLWSPLIKSWRQPCVDWLSSLIRENQQTNHKWPQANVAPRSAEYPSHDRDPYRVCRGFTTSSRHLNQSINQSISALLLSPISSPTLTHGPPSYSLLARVYQTKIDVLELPALLLRPHFFIPFFHLIIHCLS